jgi:hypothetical protein
MLIGMRLALKPGLVPVWRDGDTLQLGIDPRRGVLVCGIGRAAALIGLLDGSRDQRAMLAAARAEGITDEITDRLIGLLIAAGVLDDFPARALPVIPDEARSRLAPELATTSLAHGDGDGGARALARRTGTRVRVYGTGQVGAGIATLLASAGIGHVAGRDSAVAGRADLAVLTGPHGPELAARLVASGVPHLAATAGEAIGVVGPLVVPGRTACLHCLDLARTDRDPAWPLIRAQLIGCQPATPACDGVLATSVAAQASLQMLAFIDRGGRADAVTNGTLELVLPDWQWRRRSWRPHPACDCGAVSGGHLRPPP